MKRATVIDEWGEQAADALQLVNAPHKRKKQATILGLARAAAFGGKRGDVWRNPNCGSATAHTKWMRKDADYAAAYRLICGDEPSDPYSDGVGLAWQKRIAREDMEVDQALETFGNALRDVLNDSADYIATMKDIMRHGNKEAVRLKAAETLWGSATKAAQFIEGGE